MRWKRRLPAEWSVLWRDDGSEMECCFRSVISRMLNTFGLLYLKHYPSPSKLVALLKIDQETVLFVVCFCWTFVLEFVALIFNSKTVDFSGRRRSSLRHLFIFLWSWIKYRDFYVKLRVRSYLNESPTQRSYSLCSMFGFMCENSLLRYMVFCMLAWCWLVGSIGMGGGGGPKPDIPTVDTAEMVYISSLSLLKMLKHGK